MRRTRRETVSELLGIEAYASLLPTSAELAFNAICPVHDRCCTAPHGVGCRCADDPHHVEGRVRHATGRGELDQLGADLSFPANPSNFTVTGMPSLTGVVGEFDFHFQRRTEGVDFSGSFAHGDNLLWTVGNNGPMTFDFSSPITSFGTQVDQDFYGNALTQIYAYDSHNNLLGWGQEFFVATDGDDNTAPFIGISSTTGISRIVLYGSDRVGGNDFAINDVLIDGEGTTAPEPASIVLFATGMARSWRYGGGARVTAEPRASSPGKRAACRSPRDLVHRLHKTRRRAPGARARVDHDRRGRAALQTPACDIIDASCAAPESIRHTARAMDAPGIDSCRMSLLPMHMSSRAGSARI